MPLTLYFAGAISGGRGDVAHYRELVAALETDGHRVLAGAVAAEHVGASGEALAASHIFDRDLGWLAEADLLVKSAEAQGTEEINRAMEGAGSDKLLRLRKGLAVLNAIKGPIYISEDPTDLAHLSSSH